MWAEINGERKKVACGPCIRGHRSSKCDHRDRVLLEVRKPGRPLSSCPHPTGSCSCERVVINYTIPKTSECACPSDRPQPSIAVAGSSSRVHKSRQRKSTNIFTPSSLEKAIKVSQEGEIDASSHLTRTPTNPSFPTSEGSASNGASPPSSASSTPRIRAQSARRKSYSADVQSPDASVAQKFTRPATAKPQGAQVVSDCCKPKLTRPEPEPAQQQQVGGCCGSKAKAPPKPVQAKKSCCSGPAQQDQVAMFAQISSQPNGLQNLANYTQLAQIGQYPLPPRGVVNPGMGYLPNPPGSNMGMSLPFNFNTPIYNHLTSGYQQSTPMPSAPMHHDGSHSANHSAEHNCHCGDACSCFGCAAHPSNATMTEYIRLMHHYMSTGGFGALPPPTYDLPTYPHHPGYGAETNQNMGFATNSHSANFTQLPGPMSYQMSINAMMGMPPTPVNTTRSWQQGAMHTPLQSPPINDNQYFNINIHAQEEPQTKAEESATSPVFAESPIDEKDEETPTLSPSSYFWQELVLPGCNDETGTCQCGDGCECVGCLTHGGHNGVQLDTPTTNDQNDFSQFIASSNPTLNPLSGRFLPGAFSEAPT